MQDKTQGESVVVEGVIESKETKLTKGKEDDNGVIIAGSRKEFIRVEIMEEGNQYPTAVNCWDEGVKKQIPNYNLGDTITMYITEEKKMSAYTDQMVTYRNGVYIGENSGAGSDTAITNPAISKSTPKPKLVQRFGASQIDQNQLRIMRQSTLGYACVLHAPMVNDFATPELMMEKTIQLAGKLLEYVISGDMPLFTEESKPEKPVKAEEELFSEDEVPIAQIKGDTDENIPGDDTAEAKNS